MGYLKKYKEDTFDNWKTFREVIEYKFFNWKKNIFYTITSKNSIGLLSMDTERNRTERQPRITRAWNTKYGIQVHAISSVEYQSIEHQE